MIRFQTLCFAFLSVMAPLIFPTTALAQPTEKEWPVLGQIKKLADEPMKAAPGDDDVQKLQKERFNTALLLLKMQITRFEAGSETGHAGSLGTAMEQIILARRELTDKPADLIPLLEVRFELARAAERRAEDHLQLGRIDPTAPLAAKIVRINAEVDLLRMKKKASTQKER
jgi:hypothetical protein